MRIGNKYSINKVVLQLKEKINACLQINGLAKLPPFNFDTSPSVLMYRENKLQIFKLTNEGSLSGLPYLGLEHDIDQPTSVVPFPYRRIGPNIGDAVIKFHYNLEKALNIKLDNNYPSSVWDIVFWNLIPSKGVVVKTYSNLKDEFKPAEYYRIDDPMIPVYVSLFYKAVKHAGLKKSYLFITDALPGEYHVEIHSNFDIKKEKTKVLERIAGLMVTDKDLLQQAVSIINSNDSRFEKIFEEIIKLQQRNKDSTVNYSYCLACGRMINKDERVCPRPDTSISTTPYRCMNSLNNRIGRRLYVKNKELKKKKREELYNKLQRILIRYPLTGFDELKKKNPTLYEEKKRGRKPKK